LRAGAAAGVPSPTHRSRCQGTAHIAVSRSCNFLGEVAALLRLTQLSKDIFKATLNTPSPQHSISHVNGPNHFFFREDRADSLQPPQCRNVCAADRISAPAAKPRDLPVEHQGAGSSRKGIKLSGFCNVKATGVGFTYRRHHGRGQGRNGEIRDHCYAARTYPYRRFEGSLASRVYSFLSAARRSSEKAGMLLLSAALSLIL
jgi:hypothetical protein